MLNCMSSTALIHDLPDGRVPPFLGLRVRLQRSALDRALADGGRPEASPLLALRARQLERPTEARLVARRIDSVLHDLDHPHPGVSARIPVQRAQVIGARPFVANLAERLSEVEHPRAAGVARARLLVTDGGSPFYAPCEPGELAHLAWRAADAL
jgi:hypothetical protein